MKFVPLEEAASPELTTLWNRELAERFPLREGIVTQNVFQDRNLFPQDSWLAVDEACGQTAGLSLRKYGRMPGKASISGAKTDGSMPCWWTGGTASKESAASFCIKQKTRCAQPG